jgi:malonate-semialdehyde dehydrogenase (acetylating) / methylmalonate-semialdehyde dehydrogenase
MCVPQLGGAALNCVAGEWRHGTSEEPVEILNRATGEVLARATMAGGSDVAAAVAAASAAYPEWRRTPAQNRVQFLFEFKRLLQKHAGELARLTTQENAKTVAESRAELQRDIENVEVACGIPTLMQGYNIEDVASGIDEIMIGSPSG